MLNTYNEVIAMLQSIAIELADDLQDAQTLAPLDFSGDAVQFETIEGDI